MTQLETDRLILRRWKQEDMPVFAALNADSRVMKYMPGTLTREESNGLANRIGNHFETHGYGLCAA